MRETEASLQQFAEFLLRRRLARPSAAPFVVRWVRLFLAAPASNEALVDRVRRFCNDLERQGRQDWQVQQAEQAVRIYFVNFLNQTDWSATHASGAIPDGSGGTDPLRAVEEVRARLRTRHYSYRTEVSYVDWIRRFFEYLAKDAVPVPRVTAEYVRDYLTHLAVERRVSASTQNQALCALQFLCREVLRIEVEGLAQATRARRGSRLPVVLSIPETASLLDHMRGVSRLMAALIYGGGLRVSECCQLRVKDLDFENGLIFVRNGKGAKDRATLLPRSARDDLRAQIARAEVCFSADRRSGLAGVWTPDALDRKYPNAGRELGWFWVFPSHALSTDPRSGIVRRHHVHDSVVQKAVKAAATRAGLHKPVSVHTLRHCFATHLLLGGTDIRQIQEYLGHANVETTMVYTHVVKDLRTAPRSPLDVLDERER